MNDQDQNLKTEPLPTDEAVNETALEASAEEASETLSMTMQEEEVDVSMISVSEIRAALEQEAAAQEESRAVLQDAAPKTVSEEPSFVLEPEAVWEVSEEFEQEEEMEERPLELNDDPDAMEAEMASLASAMEDEAAKQEAELEELAGLSTASSESADTDGPISSDEIEEGDEFLDDDSLTWTPEEEPEQEFLLESQEQLQAALETLLFLADRPLTMKRIREMIGEEIPIEALDDAVAQLKERYNAAHHGIELKEIAGGYQFRTKASQTEIAKRLVKVSPQKLSKGAMETLAIVAYKQPVLKDDIDKVRGVDSSHFIRGLLDKKLVRMAGRSELPGRPILYATTPEFLEIFGVNRVQDLPPLREIEDLIPGSESENPDDPHLQRMRELVGQMKADSLNMVYDPKEDDAFLSEIRERVKGITATTPYLEAQKEAEAEAAAAATQAQEEPQPTLPLENESTTS